MILSPQYYEESLYPLQDGVLNILSQSGTDFFLTERQKEARLKLNYVSEILTGMPKSELETIAWVKKSGQDVFFGDISRIVFDTICE